MEKLHMLWLACLCLLIQHALSAAPYRSRTSGDWSVNTTWESFNGSWGAASAPPGAGDEVTILSGHTVDILLDDAEAAFIHVEDGAGLRVLGTARGLTIHNGNPAADLIVDGLFQDNASSGAGNGLNFTAGATWRLGAAGTILRTNNSSAARYRDFYDGGMSNIPATAHWIVRYVGLGDPAFTTVGTYYPNLTFESSSGPWAPLTGFSQFAGSSGTAVIKGSLDIGGAGSGTVTIVNKNLFADPITIVGGLIIRPGSELTNQADVSGTGFRVAGPLLTDGQLNLSGSGLLHLNGNGQQNWTGAGVITLSNLEINNPQGINLLRPLTVTGDLTFFNGRVMINQSDLTVLGDIVGFGPGRYVQTIVLGAGAGCLARPEAGSVVFPVGNNSFNLAIVESSGSGMLRVRVEDRVLSDGESGDQVISQVVNRTWWIDGVSPGFSLTLQWNAGDQMSGFDPQQGYIAYFDQGWQSTTPAPAAGNGPFLLTRDGLPTGGAFAVGSSGALPVALVFFRARVEKEKVKLFWRTASEYNNDFMAVERSADGRYYREVSRLPGAGTSYFPQDYEWVDEAPLPGISYYRLRQVDFDGTETLHPVATVHLRVTEAAWRLWPVPASDQITIQLAAVPAAPVWATVVGPGGRVVKRFHLPKDATTIELQIMEWPAGRYIIFRDDLPAQSKVFFKQ